MCMYIYMNECFACYEYHHLYNVFLKNIMLMLIDWSGGFMHFAHIFALIYVETARPATDRSIYENLLDDDHWIDRPATSYSG